MYDLVIKNGRIYDGTGNVSYTADIGIKDEKINKIGDLSKEQSLDTIDASDLSIMPGFIDSHCHSDMALLYDRQHASGLCQGITTELLGVDGLSYAPLSPDNLKMYAKYNAGLNGCFEEVNLDFTDVNGYLNKFHEKVSVNVAYHIPHGTIRLEALGFHDIPLKGYALEKAKDLMREGFEQGAIAFSTGLSYYPHSYSDTDELVELCKVCVEYDAPFVIHLRTVFREKMFDAVEEALEVARRSGVRLHFSHFRTNEKTCGKVDELLAPIEKAQKEGLNITMELYPYYAGSGYAIMYLPPWAVEGGYEEILKRLKDPSLREKIIKGMKENTIQTEGTFTHLKKNKKYVGMDYMDVAKKRDQSVEDMMCDILLEENLEVGIHTNPTKDEEKRLQMDKDFVHFLSKPYYMVGSDGIPLGLKPHPRAFGAFPRFLILAEKYGLSYEDFANRTSFLPAKTFKLIGRGRVSEGYFADLTIFNPKQLKDNATFESPRRSPDGIKYVIVNGTVAVYNEKVTGLFAGKALRSNI
jgi:N-acyl-D-amino-acid deacylase